MKCPYCNQEMLHGNITGSKLLRLVPDGQTPKHTHRLEQNLPKSQYENGLEGLFLDVPYAGLAPWIPADYCENCKKMIFDAGILQV